MEFLKSLNKKQAIVIAILVLILMIAMVRYFRNKAVQNASITDTATISGIPLNQSEITRQRVIDSTINSRFNPISAQQAAELENLRNDLSNTEIYKTKEFEISYSPMLRVFFVRKLTLGADQKIKEYLNNQLLIMLYEEKPNRFFRITNGNILDGRKNDEEEYIKSRELREKTIFKQQ